MKIAYFTDTYAPEINGVTNTLDYLTFYLRNREIGYLVFAPGYSSGEAEEGERDIMRFKGFRPIVNPPSRLAFPNHQQVLHALSDFKPDVVHITTELGIGYSGLRAARELGIPVVMSYHTNFDQYLSCYNFGKLEQIYWKCMAWFHSFADVNLCPSEDTRRVLARRGFKNLEIWSRGVDLSRFSPSHFSSDLRERLGGKDKTLFLYAGRIAKEKNLATLAKAIRILHGWYGDLVGFVFAGDGPYLKELQDLELPNTVFTGFLGKEELAGVYASCDVFAFPSGTETFGNVVLEAMASGLPVLCADAGGVTDFVSHLDNAYLFSCRHIMGLARAMSMLASSPALCENLRRGGLETAKEHSWDGVFDTLMTQYRKAVARSRRESRALKPGWKILQIPASAWKGTAAK